MKNWKFPAIFAALCMLIPAFVSCGDDDDEPDQPNGAQTVDVSKIIGTYNGKLGAVVMTTDVGNLPGDYDLVIAAAGDSVSVTLPECSFTYPGSQAGAYTIPAVKVGVKVSESANVYTLSDTDFSIEIDGSTYSGRLGGTVAGKDAKVEYTMRPGRMPMDINFTFTGTLK